MKTKPIALRVAELADAQGLSKQALMDRCRAQGSSIAYSTIIDYWENRVKRYDRETLNALAAALNVQPHQLFAGAPLDDSEEPGNEALLVTGQQNAIAELAAA